MTYWQGVGFDDADSITLEEALQKKDDVVYECDNAFSEHRFVVALALDVASAI